MLAVVAGHEGVTLLPADAGAELSLRETWAPEVLRIAARWLASRVRGSDLAARVGGDEFVMLLAGLSTRESLADRAASVSRHLGRPFRLGKLSLNLGASIGAALFPRDGQTEAALLATADRRMHEAKRSGVAYRIDDDGAAPAARA